MKYIPILLMLSASALRAQIPHIDYMMADEAKSQLQIHGAFTSDTTGFVTIENIKQIVRSWSDTLIICDLPDSGAGSGGHVTVSQMSGVSNVRMLSIFRFTIANPLFGVFVNSDTSWRADIETRPYNISTLVQFEIAKSSTGEWMRSLPNYRDTLLLWSDSSHFSNITITLFGTLDLKRFNVIFSPTKMQSLPFWQDGNPDPFIESYKPNLISFDTAGFITGYHNDYITDDISSQWYELHIDSLYDQKILFSPSEKNLVSQSLQPTSDFIKIFSNIGSEDHQISLEAEVPLGETTASLYSIDGRLLKQEKIFISSAGMYSFDASGINTRVGFLVLKTEKGAVAGKVLF